jgi:hypothetical protein
LFNDAVSNSESAELRKTPAQNEHQTDRQTDSQTDSAASEMEVLKAETCRSIEKEVELEQCGTADRELLCPLVAMFHPSVGAV